MIVLLSNISFHSSGEITSCNILRNDSLIIKFPDLHSIYFYLHDLAIPQVQIYLPRSVLNKGTVKMFSSFLLLPLMQIYSIAVGGPSF